MSLPRVYSVEEIRVACEALTVLLAVHGKDHLRALGSFENATAIIRDGLAEIRRKHDAEQEKP